jgi:hypothetical protein
VSKAKVSPADCLGVPTPANTNYAGYNGALLPSATDTTYTINIVSNPGNAGISFIFANSGAGASVIGTTRTFKTPDNSGVFIYAGKNGALGYFPVGNECPLQFCKTSYGWLLQIDAVGDGSYSTLVTYVQQ